MRQATLHIKGMSCGHCLSAVNRALSAVPGVQVDAISIGHADVSYHESTTRPSQLAEAVTGAGYPAEVTVDEPTAIRKSGP